MSDFSDRDARLYLARVAEYPAPQIRAYAADDGVIIAASAIRAEPHPSTPNVKPTDPASRSRTTSGASSSAGHC
jgi:hypothetical protein